MVGATAETVVREVYATGTVTGHLSGGVVGFLKHEGVLRDSYSRLTVDWNWQGGLLCDFRLVVLSPPSLLQSPATVQSKNEAITSPPSPMSP